MSLLLLLHGAGTAAFTPITFGNIPVLVMPDEVPVGTDCTVGFEVTDSTGRKTLDGPAQWRVYATDESGARQTVIATALMSMFGSDDFWTGSFTPPKNGVYEVIAVGEVGGTAYVASGSLTARAKFDPIIIATEGELGTRMDRDPLLFDL